MRTSISVSLNGIPLDSIDKSIITGDVSEEATSMNVATSSRFGVYGQRVLQREKRSTNITVKFFIGERDLERRYNILERIRAWAEGGTKLSLSVRPGRFLSVMCSKLPSADYKRKFDQEYQMTFTAYTIPEWQSATPTMVNLASCRTGECTMSVAGTARTKLEFTAKNVGSDVCDSIQVSVNGYRMTFIDILLDVNDEIVVEYDADDIMSARIGNRSVLAMRLPSSSDDLWLKHGANTISVSSDSNVSYTFKATGRWV